MQCSSVAVRTSSSDDSSMIVLANFTAGVNGISICFVGGEQMLDQQMLGASERSIFTFDGVDVPAADRDAGTISTLTGATDGDAVVVVPSEPEESDADGSLPRFEDGR
jgi:hypothetical protein